MRKTVKISLAFLTFLAIMTPLFLYSVPVHAKNSPDNLLNGMTTEQKVTQLLMPDFRSWENKSGEEAFTAMNDEVKKVINQYDFGGVILFAENVQGTEQTARLTYDYRKQPYKTMMRRGIQFLYFLQLTKRAGVFTV